MTALALATAFLGQALVDHTFRYEAASNLRSVHVAGTFNGWNKAADPMRNEPGTRLWTLSKRLPQGKHHYKFVLDGDRWITDPKSARDEDDGNGNVNSVLLIVPDDFKTPASRTDANIAASALFHEQAPPYLNYDRGTLSFKLRTRAGDAERVILLTGGRATPMRLTDGDDFYEWHSASLPWNGRSVLEYVFRVESGAAAREVRPTAQTRFQVDPKGFRPVEVPSWPERTVTYQIFPDRFANGDKRNDPPGVVAWDGKPEYYNFFGGDAAGVVQNLDYLDGLGIGAIYFNPVFVSPSNHRYETTDYLRVDPRFGTNEEFASMTRALRRRGIRTVLDGVFNHTATDFPPFADLIRNGEASRYRDWYYVRSYPVKVQPEPNYEAWFGFPSMPKLNVMHPEAKAYLLKVPGFWDRSADIAGWRLDVANEVPMEFWREFRGAVKRLGKDRWIVGEIWGDGGPWLKGDQWDSIMGYQFRDAAIKFVAEQKIGPREFMRRLMRVHESYSPQVARNLMILLGSHDTPRFLTLCQGNEDLARLAATLQLTWVGAPSIYYGDELGMAGDRDPDNRRGMEWSRNTKTNRTLAHYKALISARNGSRALQSGDPLVLHADDDRGTLAYARSLPGDAAVVVVNRSAQGRSISLSLPKELRRRLGRPRNALDDRPVTIDRHGQLTLSLPPRGAAVLLPGNRPRHPARGASLARPDSNSLTHRSHS